ncbi:unnamed protein product [Psylliodes chrysocephalus]|uniref:Uncharacterized protein n=1 Tax=Psylliodes chrysocephalus TaxID=3402493 RepID=A0A9P0GB06_9CUCU|nr:unnamed protein product [Psylliodes chrysocephala]
MFVSLKKRIVSTRQSIRAPVFGEPRDFCKTLLPCDVMRYFLFVQNGLNAENGDVKNKTVAEIVEIVEKVQQILCKASLPTISNQQCIALLKKYQKQFMDIKKSIKRQEKLQKIN